MRNGLMGLVALSLLGVPSFSVAQEGAAAGAITGAVTGGIVGGPIGAAVGAGVGGLAGAAAEDSAKRGPDTVVVQPGREVVGGTGCASETVRTENSFGDSKTVTRERC